MKIRIISTLLVTSISISSIGCSFQSATIIPNSGDTKIKTDTVSDKINATGNAASGIIMALAVAAMMVAASNSSENGTNLSK